MMATTLPFIARLRRGGRWLARDTRGVTVVEFGLIIFPLCILLLGGLDLGYQSYLRSTLQSALNDVARTASLEAPELGCAGDTVEERIHCALQERTDIVARGANYDVVTTNFYQFSGIGRSEKLVTDRNGNGRYDPGDCWENLDFEEEGDDPEYDLVAGRDGIGGADDVAFYEVTLNAPRLFPMQGFLNVDDEYHIVARAAIRNQPYTRQTLPPTVC